MLSDPPLPDDPAHLAQLIMSLGANRSRIMIGIAGAPGSGKSRLTALVAQHLAAQHNSTRAVAVVPMDGFHLGNAVLAAHGWASRKGAPHTFDADGFAALLHRIKNQATRPVYVPDFDRRLDEPIAQASCVWPETRVILVEGNYLLLDEPAWANARAALDEAWYLDVPGVQRRAWLAERHIRFGMTATQARTVIAANDEPNAMLIQSSRARADRIVAVPAVPAPSERMPL